MSSRRSFLKESAVIVAGTLLTAQNSHSFFNAKPKHVIILGAGFAGLAAAQELVKKRNKSYRTRSPQQDRRPGVFA